MGDGGQEQTTFIIIKWSITGELATVAAKRHF